MLMNLLNVCDYLLIALILLPGSNPRSLNADQSRRTNETSEDGAKSLVSVKKFNNFVDGQCPPSSNILNVNGLNGKCKYECNNDVDCTEDYKCCEYGCSFVCMEPWFPDRVVDWAKSSSRNQVTAPCSTSVLDGLQPLSCPTNYVCQITMDGDEQLNIPNRGECTGINQQKLPMRVIENDNHHELSIDKECLHKGETYKHKEKFRKDCNICVCHNGVVFCDNRPCARTIGIPAVVSSYKEHKQTSKYQYISIDSNNDDTENASGSGDDQLREERDEKSLIAGENIELTDDEDPEVSSDGDTEQRKVGSGDAHKAHGREVDSKDKEEVGGSDDEQGKSNNGEIFLVSESAGTEKPKITNPTTTTEIYTKEFSTLTKKTFTLAPETSTVPAKTTTMAPQTSTTAQQKQTSKYQYISIDSNNDDTENASGSGDDQLREERDEKSLIAGENIELTDDEDPEVSSDDSDGDTAQRREVGSGDDDKAHGREVDSKAKEEVGSGDDGQGKSDYREIFLVSESSGTEKPTITNPSTTTETYAKEFSTLTKKTSTLAPETSTVPAKTTTMAPQTSTSAQKTTMFELETIILAPKAYTSLPGVDERETTEVPKRKPTEDIVRLKESDYETSGLDVYSGDDGEEYSGSSGDDGSSDRDEGSTEEILEPEQVYPDTIVLAKYNPTANESAVFGFETDEKIDVIHDGSLHRNNKQESEEDSASGEIEGRKHGQKYKRNSKTSEYIQTTDDEQ